MKPMKMMMKTDGRVVSSTTTVFFFFFPFFSSPFAFSFGEGGWKMEGRGVKRGTGTDGVKNG